MYVEMERTWTLGVEHDSAGALRGNDALADVGDDAGVVLVVPMGEVEACDVHTGLGEAGQGLDVLGLGADGADDLGADATRLEGLEGILTGEVDFEVVLQGSHGVEVVVR